MKIRNLISIVFFFILAVHSSFACSRDGSNFNDYRIELNCNKEEGLESIKIYKLTDRLPLFVEEGRVVSIYSPATTKHKYSTIQDIERYSIVESYSGGAHCCWSYYLLDLGDQFKRLLKLDTYDSTAKIIAKNPGDFLIYFYDNSYSNKWNSFASAPRPLLILSYKGSELLVSEELMKKPSLKDDAFSIKVSNIKKSITKDFEYKRDNFSENGKENLYLNILLSEVFDLIYSGNYSQAKRMINETWPSDEKSKENFIHDIITEIKKNTYKDAILRMNGLK